MCDGKQNFSDCKVDAVTCVPVGTLRLPHPSQKNHQSSKKFPKNSGNFFAIVI